MKLIKFKDSSIKILCFKHCIVDFKIINLLKYYKKLEELYFIFVEITNKQMEAIISILSTLPYITVLAFAFTPLHIGGLHSLTDYLKSNRTVKELTLRRSLLQIKNIDGLIDVIANSGTIELVNLTDNRLIDHCPTNVAKLLRSKSIKNLNLTNNGLTLSEINISTTFGQSTIELLNLSNNVIYNSVFNSILLNLNKNHVIKELYLDSNNICLKNIDGITKFLSTNDSLEILSLNSNFIDQIYYSGFFKALATNNTLEQLCLDNNINEIFYTEDIRNNSINSLTVVHMDQFLLSNLEMYIYPLIDSNIKSLHIFIETTEELIKVLNLLRHSKTLIELVLDCSWSVPIEIPQIVSVLKHNYTLITFECSTIQNSKSIKSLLKRNRHLQQLKYQVANLLKDSGLQTYARRILPKVVYNDCFNLYK